MRVAVAGLGWWGKQIISCLVKSPRFEVLHGVDPSPPEGALDFLAHRAANEAGPDDDA